jgi:RNA polymerase sigma factor (sigma-70 family)
MDDRAQEPSTATEQRARALDQLLRARRGKLLRHIRFHSHDPEQAEDVLGESCVQFMRFWDGPRDADPLPWMLVVSKRCAWAATRKRRRIESRTKFVGMTPEPRSNEEVILAGGPGPQEQVERAEDQAHLIELIEGLKPDERTALILLGLGCSYAEIATARGWSLTKVNRCVAEGREAVRRRLRGGES